MVGHFPVNTLHCFIFVSNQDCHIRVQFLKKKKDSFCKNNRCKENKHTVLKIYKKANEIYMTKLF